MTAKNEDHETPSEMPEEGLDKNEDLEKELANVKDKYLRTVAEMDNMRRRLDKDRADTHKYALEGIMMELIPVLDSFDKALPNGDGQNGSEQGVLTGMQMVQKQLMAVLAKNGLQVVPAKDQPFDPNFHQAIQKIESADVDQEKVKDEFAKGYSLNGRLIRAAMVSVVTPSHQQ